MKKLGYREMLRDRCPKVVDLALKFTKSKNAWVEHTYTHFVNMLIPWKYIPQQVLKLELHFVCLKVY